MRHNSGQVILVISIISLLLFILLSTQVMGINSMTIVDLVVNLKINLIQSPGLTGLMIVITSIGSEICLTIFAVALYIFMLHRKKIRNSMIIVSAMITGLLLQVLIKSFVQRPRPENALVNMSSFSFPSGHTLMSTIFFIVFIYSIKNEIKAKALRMILISISIILIPLIAFSRIYLNVHYLTDIIGGFLLGLFIVTFFIFLIEKKR